MVRVLVIGASGYIGLAIAQALRRAGHRVTGVVRNKDNEILLAKNEIVPVHADAKEIKKYESHIESAAVIIDATDIINVEHSTNLLLAVTNASKKTGIPKRFIYTSGILAYGDHKNEVIDETYPTLKYGRTEIEKMVTSHKDLEGVVIRPAWIYGGSSGRYITPWFELDSKGEIEIVGNPDKSWSWAHIDDLAAAYVKVVEASKGLVAGEIFDVADETRIGYQALRVAFAKAAGLEGKVVHVPAGTDLWSKLMDVTVLVSATKIRQVLGWKPTRGTLLDNLDLYYLAYRAHNPKSTNK